jgi:5-methylcytosine-specific restriction endonuclease McrA
MIRINLSPKIIEKIKKKHRFDFFENIKTKTKPFENIKSHLTELRNDGYINFTNLFISPIRGDISNKEIKILICIDSKKTFENFVQKAEKAIALDSDKTKKSIDKIKQEILGSADKGFLKFYNNFSQRDWAIEFLELLNCNVCPYCNRIYTFTVNNNHKCKPEFDHYFPKKEYPYLSVSIFNLIPSCSYCNKGKSNNCVDSGFKHRLIYPFEESFQDENLQIKFSIESDTINYLYGDFSDVKIKIKSKSDKNLDLIKNYNSYFKVDSLYSLHTDYVEEILNNAIIYGNTMTRELLDQYSDMFSTKEDIFRMIFGNYVEPKDFLKRPLSKLTHDLLEELGVYK